MRVVRRERLDRNLRRSLGAILVVAIERQDKVAAVKEAMTGRMVNHSCPDTRKHSSLRDWSVEKDREESSCLRFGYWRSSVEETTNEDNIRCVGNTNSQPLASAVFDCRISHRPNDLPTLCFLFFGA